MKRKKSHSFMDLEHQESINAFQDNSDNLLSPNDAAKNFKLPLQRSSSFEDTSKIELSPIFRPVEEEVIEEEEDAQDFLEPEEGEQHPMTLPLHLSVPLLSTKHMDLQTTENEEQHSLISSANSSSHSSTQLPSFMIYSPRIDHFPAGIANIPLTSPRQCSHASSTQTSTPSSPMSSTTPQSSFGNSKQHILQIRKRGFLHQLTSFHQQQQQQQQQQSQKSHPRTSSSIASPSNYYWNSLSTNKKHTKLEPKMSPTTYATNSNNLLPLSSPWSKRYVALTQDTIYLFKSPQDKKAFGFIECASIYRIEPMHSPHPQQQTNLYTYKKRNFCFSIRTYARSYMFSCESEMEMKEWIRELERSMRDCISESMIHSFRHLLNSHHDDSQLFLSTIFEKMALVNTKWSMNRREFIQDLEQYVVSQQSQLGSGNTTPRMTSPLSFSKFEIDYKELVVEKKIAEGAFGEVFCGKLWGKRVAVKRLKLNYRSQQSKEDWDHIIDKLQQEAQIMSELHHPNVLLLIAVCTQLPNICLVSEFVEQGNLYDFLSQQLVTDWTLFCKMVKDIICGMAYLHNRNVLHLDLKPLNILVQNGSIKIADFGISKFLRRKEETLQQSFSGYGTLLYLSDEILYHNTYSIKSDVFSFGILLYELVYMREHPDCNFTERDSIGFNLLREPISKRQKPKIPPWWDKTLSQLIISCISQDPNERPTFDQIVTLLYESPISPLFKASENDEWFIMREHSKNMLRLSKQCSHDESLKNSLLEFQFWEVLQYTLSIAKDKQVITNCLFAMVQFAVNFQTITSCVDTFSMVLQRWEQELQDDLVGMQQVVSSNGTYFGYFSQMLLFHDTTKNIQKQVLEILLKLIQTHPLVALRFVHQHLIATLVQLMNQQEDEIMVLICNILACLASNYKSGELMKKFCSEGGVDALVQFTKVDKTMVTALHSLAELSQVGEFALLIEERGIKPIQLAMRAFAPSISNGIPRQQFTLKRNFSFLENTAFERNHLREEGEKILPQMRLSFAKAKERFNSVVTPVSVPQRHSSVSNMNLMDTSSPSNQQSHVNFVVQELWSILTKNTHQLETISTSDLKTQLLAQYESQMVIERKHLASQIDLLIGQMESPSQLTNYLYLGSEWNASKLSELQSLSISIIINVSQESPNYFPHLFTYHHIPIQPHNELIYYFEQIFSIIESAKRSNQKVLLHSLFGVSRAASFGVGYLMLHRKYSLQKAFKYVKDLRPIINPSRDYMRQLMTYEMTLQGTSTLGLKIITSDNQFEELENKTSSPQLSTPTHTQYVNTPDTSFL